MSFPSKDLLDDYKHRMEEAKRRDHRNVGTQQGLFFFDRLSPGSCFFLPPGARIYNALIQASSNSMRCSWPSESILFRAVMLHPIWQVGQHDAPAA